MDFDMLAYLRDHSKFTGLARLMLYEIELHATQETHRSFPSMDLLAQHMGVTPRRAQQLLRTLITAGAVQVRHGGGRGGTNTYQLPDLPERVKPISGFPGERVKFLTPKG
jgi:DNA replication protein DnaD